MGHPSKIQMQLLCILVGMLALLAMSGPFIGVASAQARASRKLRSFEMDENDDGWEIRLRLDYAARILRQVPDKLGKAIRIQIDPLDLDTVPRIGGPIREVLPLPSETKGPLVEIAFEQRTVDESYVEIEFDEPMSFEVRQGDDLRILLVRMRPLSAMNVTGLPADPRLDPSLADPGTPIDSQAAERLERARVAIRNGELERASTLLLKIVESGTDDVPVAVKRDARELLGLTRHSRGQLAHARAEYERYLELRQILARHVSEPSTPAGAERRKTMRVPTRLLIEYRTADQLRDAIIHNVSQGGLFISTDAPQEIGTKFTLCLAVGEMSQRLEVPCEVVTNNIAGECSTDGPGMGIRFDSLDVEQRHAVDLLFAEALGQQLDGDSIEE
jgi:uncharacterized protein (TIGR02266 family)